VSEDLKDEKPPARPPVKDNFVFNAARYTSIASSLPAGVLAGYFIGYALDAWLQTTYLKIVFLILGIVAGFWELIRLLMRDLRK